MHSQHCNDEKKSYNKIFTSESRLRWIVSAFALMDFLENLLVLEMAKYSEMDNADFIATSPSMSVLLKRFVILEPLIILSCFSWNSH